MCCCSQGLNLKNNSKLTWKCLKQKFTFYRVPVNVKEAIKVRSALLCSLFLATFNGIGELSTRDAAVKRWITVQIPVLRSQRAENLNCLAKQTSYPLHRRWLTKVFQDQEQYTLFQANNSCINWPFFTMIRTITYDCYLLKVTSNLPFTRKRKLSKCSIAYYSNATATRRILLLSGDIDLNPGWGNG